MALLFGLLACSGVIAVFAVSLLLTGLEQHRLERAQRRAARLALDRWRLNIPETGKAASGRFAERSITVRDKSGERQERLRVPLDEREAAWYRAMEDGFWWAWANHSLSSTSLVGPDKAFASPKDWMCFTDTARNLGMVVKVNGIETGMAPGWTYKRAIEYFQQATPWAIPLETAPKVRPWTGQSLRNPPPLPPPPEVAYASE